MPHWRTLDDPNVLKPNCHVHHDERVAGFDVAGTLPRYHEWEEEDGTIATVQPVKCYCPH